MIQNTNDDIGVVIALFQGELHIEETLDSILAQNELPAEVVVVDDGSTDNGHSIVIGMKSEFSSKGIKLNLIRKDNGGQGSARNLGVASLSAKYVAFLDQDDIWENGHLQSLYGVINQSNSDKLGWVYSDFNEIDELSRIIRRGYLSNSQYKSPKHDIFCMLGQDLMMLPSASLIRVDAFLKVGGFDPQFRGYEDDDLFLRLFLDGWNFSYNLEPNINYRIHSGNSSGGTSFLKSRLRFFRKMNSLFSPSSDYFQLVLHRYLGPRIMGSYLLDGYSSTRRKDWVFLREVAANYKLAIKEFENHNSFKNSIKQQVTLFILRNKFIAVPVFRIYGIFASTKAKKDNDVD